MNKALVHAEAAIQEMHQRRAAVESAAYTPTLKKIIRENSPAPAAYGYSPYNWDSWNNVAAYKRQMAFKLLQLRRFRLAFPMAHGEGVRRLDEIAAIRRRIQEAVA